MKIEVLFFGGLRELMGCSSMPIIEVDTTDNVLEKLNQVNDKLAGKTFQLALNNKLIKENTPIENGDQLALLPPFAGG
jgi:molybdopterin converting factor small subunit